MQPEAQTGFGASKPSKQRLRGLFQSPILYVVFAIVGFSILIVIVFLMSNYLYPQYKRLINGNLPQEPAAWDVQLSLAQQEATKFDKDAVLFDVFAYPHGWWPNQTATYDYTISDTLDITFRFAGSSGAVITVSFQDTAPTTTLHTRQVADLIRADVQDRREKYADSIEQIRLSPRDAIRQTWQDATVQVHEQAADIVPFVQLNTDTTPVSWRVHYRTPGILEFYYEVDGQDGKINRQWR